MTDQKAIRELRIELEATKYFIKVLFALKDTSPQAIEVLVEGLKNQIPQLNSVLTPDQTDAFSSELLSAIIEVGGEIQEYLEAKR
jgi:hypothetical protein